MTDIIQPPLLSVSQLTQAIKINLESNFAFVYLQGEISNLKLQSSGHLYFSLKDSLAQISAVMFKTDVNALKTIPRCGDHVIVKGEVGVYAPKGNYQLIVRELAYAGLGEFLRRLEQLKIKLHQLGWFKAVHKKPLPRFPKSIGVITSPTGAVLHDILHVLTRRCSGFHLILNPVKVQGEGAAQEIAQAIEQFNTHRLADVLIVGRGGGSLEDLWAFNEEIVASAIFHSAIPIISAVGHETDHCIADYVADVRAPTPSAAAEMVMGESQALLNYLENMRRQIYQHMRRLIQQNCYRLFGIIKHPLITYPKKFIEWHMQKLDDICRALDLSIERYLQQKVYQLHARSQQTYTLKPINQISNLQQKLVNISSILHQHMHHYLNCHRQKLITTLKNLDQKWHLQRMQRGHLFNRNLLQKKLQEHILHYLSIYKNKLIHMQEILQALDPRNLLQKGYSILFSEKESCVINSVQQLHTGQTAKLLLSDGEVMITIQSMVIRERC